jgi:hypothetical protein
VELKRKTIAAVLACAVALLALAILADDLSGDDAFDILAEPVAMAIAAFALATLARVADVRRGVSGSQWVLTLSDPRSPPRA